MKKYVIVIFILADFFCQFSCSNSTAPKNSGKKSIKEKISFFYPHDWKLKGKNFGPGKIYGLNPSFVSDSSTFFVFEIIEMPSGGHPFKDFQEYGFNFNSKRTDDEVEIMSKRIEKFKGLETEIVELNMRRQNVLYTSISVYIINGNKNYYLINITRDIPGIKYKLDDISTLILNSINISS